MISAYHEHFDLLIKELNAYFQGKLKVFFVPLHTPGNEFAQRVWKRKFSAGAFILKKQQAK